VVEQACIRGLAGLLTVSLVWTSLPVAALAAPAEGGDPPTDAAAPADEAAPTAEGAAPADEGAAPADEGAAPTDEGAAPTDEGTPTAPDDGTSPVAAEPTPEPEPSTTDGDGDAPNDNETAAWAFREGSDAYELGHFAEAAAKFGIAWELSHKVPLLYNLGQAHWKWFDVDPEIEHLRQARLAFTNYDKRMRLTDDYDPTEIEDNLKAIQKQIDEEEARITEANRPVVIQSAAMTEEELQREYRRRTTKRLNGFGIALIVVGSLGLGTGIGGLGSRAVHGALLDNTSGNEDTMVSIVTAEQDERRRNGYTVSGQVAFGALIAGAIILPVGITLRVIGARRMKLDGNQAADEEEDAAKDKKRKKKDRKQARARFVPGAGGLTIQF